MPLTKVIAICSASQKIRRRVVILDHAGADDSQFKNHISDIKNGELLIEIPIDDYKSFGSTQKDIEIGNTLDVHISSLLGNPEDDKCAVVDKDGGVLGIIRADPAIDYHPLGEIIAHPEVAMDWKYENGDWIIPAVVAVEVLETVREINLEEVTFNSEERKSTVPYGSFNTDWLISCVDKSMSIGCQTHLISEWESYSDAEAGLFAEPIIQTAKWWKDNKKDVLAFAQNHLARIGS